MATALNPTVQTVLFPRPDANASAARRIVGEYTDAALDLLFPPHCVSCDTPLPPQTNKALCLECAQKIRWITTDRCQRCGDGVGAGSGTVPECPSCRTYPPVFVETTCAVAHYADGPLRDLILALKFGRKLHLARVLGELLAARIAETQLGAKDTVLVPVPLTPASSSQRGFNHTEELALWVGRRLTLPVETRLLKKIRGTPPQAVLTHEQRRKNLAGAFACNTKLAAKHNAAQILLIDDVITTCSTVSECARTLHGCGVRRISAASVAR